ncbi:UBN2 domain-containing protein, partial [Cephalotus follicularis]
CIARREQSCIHLVGAKVIEARLEFQARIEAY